MKTQGFNVKFFKVTALLGLALVSGCAQMRTMLDGDNSVDYKSVVMADPLSNDAVRLYRLIERHRHYTNSARAKLILDNWNQYLPKFVKIVPVDFRRALNEIADSNPAKDEPAKGRAVMDKAHG